MGKFFVPSLDSHVRIEGELFRHIAKSLRMKPGEKIVLCDGEGNDGFGIIDEVAGDFLTVNIQRQEKSLSEPNTKVGLFVAWPKGDKADLIVQKAVEIGACSITFLMSEFCVSKPRESDYSKKISRLQKIALEASTQSGRGIIPSVRGILPFVEGLKEMQKYEKPFMLYEGECPSMRKSLESPKGSYALLTGPEGGFSSDEVRLCMQSGIPPVSLGRRILRCETAPLTALSALLFFLGDMD